MRPIKSYLFSAFLLVTFSHITISAKAQHKELSSSFEKIIVSQNASRATADSLWQEIVRNYQGPSRHYHTLTHLDNFYNQLNKCKNLLQDKELLTIAMVYHDVIYNSPDHKDEERSADLAVERLTQIGFPTNQIEKVKALILATKAHAESTDGDTNYFNDADMSILGLDREIYQNYVRNVGLEYGNTPAFSAGRKRVLQYFLSMPQIFKTHFFYDLYEKSARENITWELSTLP